MSWHVLQEQLDEIAGDDVALLAVSTRPDLRACGPTPTRRASPSRCCPDFWPHGAVATAYGVFSEEVGIALRGTFLVDRDGVVRWSVVNDIPDARDVDEYKKAIAAL